MVLFSSLWMETGGVLSMIAVWSHHIILISLFALYIYHLIFIKRSTMQAELVLGGGRNCANCKSHCPHPKDSAHTIIRVRVQRAEDRTLWFKMSGETRSGYYFGGDPENPDLFRHNLGGSRNWGMADSSPGQRHQRLSGGGHEGGIHSSAYPQHGATVSHSGGEGQIPPPPPPRPHASARPVQYASASTTNDTRNASTVPSYGAAAFGPAATQAFGARASAASSVAGRRYDAVPAQRPPIPANRLTGGDGAMQVIVVDGVKMAVVGAGRHPVRPGVQVSEG